MTDLPRKIGVADFGVGAQRDLSQKSAVVRLALSVGRFFWLLPARILISLLIGYRWAISPLYGQVCRYFPSCSGYALEAITVHGSIRGTYLALRRLLRCHPWAAGGIDPVPERHSTCLHEDTSGELTPVPRIIMLNHPERYTDHVLTAQPGSTPSTGESASRAA